MVEDGELEALRMLADRRDELARQPPDGQPAAAALLFCAPGPSCWLGLGSPTDWRSRPAYATNDSRLDPDAGRHTDRRPSRGEVIAEAWANHLATSIVSDDTTRARGWRWWGVVVALILDRVFGAASRLERRVQSGLLEEFVVDENEAAFGATEEFGAGSHVDRCFAVAL